MRQPEIVESILAYSVEAGGVRKSLCENVGDDFWLKVYWLAQIAQNLAANVNQLLKARLSYASIEVLDYLEVRIHGRVIRVNRLHLTDYQQCQLQLHHRYVVHVLRIENVPYEVSQDADGLF